MLSTVKLIAEPWDCGPGGYQVGGFPPGWAEWNDKFRDTVRDFWRGHAPSAALAPRLLASPDCFDHQGRKPWASINFVAAHDGFTVHDLVTYNAKHNEANGEDNNDGTNDNRSWNCGAEGPSDDPEIISLRQRQIRNILGTLLLAQGTPMLLAGDEFARSQDGNNNAYCQDNEISWVNWELRDKNALLIGFVRRLIDLRRRYPVLHRARFLTGEVNADLGTKDVTWINPSGEEMRAQAWGESALNCFAMLIDGRVHRSFEDEIAGTLLIVLNGHYEPVDFTLPRAARGEKWSLLMDTSCLGEVDACCYDMGDVYPIGPRALIVFDFSRLD